MTRQSPNFTYVAKCRTDRGDKVIRITGYSRLFGYLEYILAIHGSYQCVCVSSAWIYGYPWLSMVIHGYPWLSVVICGYPWLSVVIHGYPWLSVVIRGYPWLSVVIYN